MAHRLRPRPEIAADAGASRRSIQRRLNARLRGGLDRLRPRKARGRPQLTDDLAQTLRQRVVDGPQKQGLDRADWTHAELADRFFKAEGGAMASA